MRKPSVFVQAGVVWLAMVIVLLSCTQQPSILTTPLKPDSQSQLQRRPSLLPRNTSFSQGEPPKTGGFKIQDYPLGTSCDPASQACISSLNANMTWSAPAWQPQGGSLTLAIKQDPTASANF
jgi:hypothetical protein